MSLFSAENVIVAIVAATVIGGWLLKKRRAARYDNRAPKGQSADVPEPPATVVGKAPWADGERGSAAAEAMTRRRERLAQPRPQSTPAQPARSVAVAQRPSAPIAAVPVMPVMKAEVPGPGESYAVPAVASKPQPAFVEVDLDQMGA